MHRWKSILIAALGIVAGFSVSFLKGKSEQRSDASVPEHRRATIAASPDDGLGRREASQDELVRLSRRLARVEQDLTEYRERDEARPPDDSSTQDIDEQAELLRAETRFSAALEQFDSLPLDPHWAPQASSSLTSELNALSGSLGYEIADVQCKNRQCVARLDWPSPQAAAARVAEVVHARYSINCAMDVMVNTLSGDAGRVQTPIVFSGCK
ncbi:hypothetical protein WME94_54750 [Sorangium sp. So ce429]